ncbi:MAG TPA: sigma-70 family RNA polymerase sigma factor [Solirubrobacter sp.]|jgi:RNA polymerase sigma-B factor|nr:sigma-70 family RNA polymerase sigma factor [Solirubrobacter sp.]
MNSRAELRRVIRSGVRGGAAPAARDRLLFRRYRDAADPLDRDELVRRFMPLAQQLAARYAGGDEPYDDLLQVASLALVRAIDRFDPDRGVAFSSYAVPTICGEIKHHFRDATWAVRVPRDLRQLAVAATAERERLTVELGRSPTVRELAECMHASERALDDAVRAGNAYETVSLELPQSEHDAELTLGDKLPYHEHGYDVADARASLDRLLRTLGGRDREVLRMRFEEDLTLQEIGRRVGLSAMHVSRIIRAAIEQLSETAEGFARASAR